MPREPLLTGCKFTRIHPNKTRRESLLKNACIPWVLIGIESRCRAGRGKIPAAGISQRRLHGPATLQIPRRGSADEREINYA